MASYSAPDTRGLTGEDEFDETGKLDETSLVCVFNARLSEARSHYNDWRQEARDLYELIAGRQWSTSDQIALDDEKRPAVTFNLAGKYLDAIVGLQINNRQDIRFYPRELGDAKPSELLTASVEWARDKTDAADEETDAFLDCVLVGAGWVELSINRDVEPGGVPGWQRVDPLEMFPDPFAKRRNLADARYLIRLRMVDPDTYRDLMGEDEPDSVVTDLSDLSFIDDEDDALTFIEQPQDYQRNRGPNAYKRRRPIADYQFWRREPHLLVKSQRFGEKLFHVEHDWPKVKQMLDAVGEPYQAEPVKHKVYYRAIIGQGRVGKMGRSPYQDGFTYHAITGKRDRNTGTWYGVGRAILEPQRWVNKFFSTILYILMTNAKGGLMAEEGAFADPSKAQEEWANPSAITWLAGGALSGQAGPKIVEKTQSKYPEGLDRLLQFTANVLPQTTGLNLELLGLADRVQAGVVEAQRKQSAMAIIAWAFDGMRRYYRSSGHQAACYIRDYVPEGTLVMVQGEENKQYMPILKSRLPLRFDVIVDEAPTSVNMKERVWMVLEGIIPHLLKAGMKIPPDVLDYSPLPADLAAKWKKAMQPTPESQKAAALQEAQAEAEVKQTQADALLKQSQAQKARHDAQLLPLGDNGEQLDPNIAIQARMDAQLEKLKAFLTSELDRQGQASAERLASINNDSKERIAALTAAVKMATTKSAKSAKAGAPGKDGKGGSPAATSVSTEQVSGKDVLAALADVVTQLQGLRAGMVGSTPETPAEKPDGAVNQT